MSRRPAAAVKTLIAAAQAHGLDVVALEIDGVRLLCRIPDAPAPAQDAADTDAEAAWDYATSVDTATATAAPASTTRRRTGRG